MTLRIITNNVPRDVINAWELAETERADFDYLDWDAIMRGEDSASFVRYQGTLYDLNDTEGTFPADRRWFYTSDTFSSGILFRYATDEWGEPDSEAIIVGRYLA